MAAHVWTRRGFLGSTAVGLLFAGGAEARSISGQRPWAAFSASAPELPFGDGWLFLTQAEANSVDAIVARLIPADDLGPGAKEARVTTFIDRQLAGTYGTFSRFYMQGPFARGTPQQGAQSANIPHVVYRQGLIALDKYCAAQMSNKRFVELTPAQQDQVLQAMEKNDAKFDGPVGAPEFFSMLLQNTREGFFADPIYGGNRDMIGWKLVGFPGARYDYRDHVAKHNQPYPLPPVSLYGRSDWTVKG